jgi:hypothetical protein
MSDLSGSNWTEIDAGNTTTPPLGWPEGQMPSTVNDCARMMMGALKRFWNRLNGVVTTTGGTGYTYTTANTSFPTAYVTGETYRWKAHRTSTGGDVLQINSLASHPLYKRGSSGPSQIAAGDIVSGDMVSVTFDQALNASAGGFWCNDSIGSLSKTDAATNYVPASGGTISGNLGVGGTLNVSGDCGLGSTAINGIAAIYGTGQALDIPNGSISVGGYVAAVGIVEGGTLATSGNLTVNGTGTLGYIHSTGNEQIDGSLTVNGAIYCNNYQTLSDARQKQDIEAVPGDCLDRVRAITPRTYQWAGYWRQSGRPDNSDDEQGRLKRHWGFIAQEVGAVMGPRFGGHLTDETGTLERLAYNELLAVLWGAVRELSDEVARLRQ